MIETIGYTDVVCTVSANGRSVFIEANGDLVLRGSRKPYKNAYIFRVDFNADGLFETFTEYTNSPYLVQTLDLAQSQ